MVFYESVFLVHGKYPAHETRLLLREAARAVTERDGCVLRLLDLGWRHTPQPIRQKRVGIFFYGRWFSMTFGSPPPAVREVQAVFQHNTGVLRHITQKIRHPHDMYMPRSTFYPMLGEGPKLTHHTGPSE
eukprot:gnl/TRDRNA2_/TRDRNA2_191795_c0_seq1.p1 gnl/TRDRNA2_/TRDRNA2_191795_c0~~gnl/TRDRNA2_/TRDRNA2_191795_c0_seq1.p1  ORF type:complete len:130 (-),score=13.23 gnl/TRDRNA2_/TRDRNA2_191795_c0_seq1:127-516(-)